MSLGVNLLDLAPSYWDGGAERAAGAALKALFAESDKGTLRRDQLIVLTKVLDLCWDFGAWQIFGGLVLGCIKTKFCKQICV